MLKKLDLFACFFQKWVHIAETLMKLNICLFNISWWIIRKVWEKVRNSIKNEFDTGPVFNEKCLRSKVKYFKGKININFHNNKMLKEDSKCICLTVILIDSVYRKDNNYYPQVFLKECKHVVKEKKMSEYITDEIEISFADSDREDSDEENSVREH